jgi:hypothetical protein
MKSTLVFALLALAAGTAQAADLHLHAVLDSTPMVPAADSTATGEAKAVLHDDGKVQINVVFAGLSSDVTEVALHTGANNATGPSIATLDARKTPAGLVVNQQLTLDDDAAADMRAGNTYLLVVTGDRPSGALRGQLMPQPARLPSTTP